MSERDGFEPGVPCWVDTLQPDPEAALSFYSRLFGWDFEGSGPRPGDPVGEYNVARLRGRDVAGVATQPAEGGPPAWNTYVQVQSADDAVAKAQREGGSVLVEPFDAQPAGRGAVVADPEGAAFCLWEPGQRKGAHVVNEPGAWAMSALNTRDPERAEDFYGKLFGWTTEAFDLGGAEIKMWRLPGFVGGEPEQPVARDVVATMATMKGEDFPEDVPAHWSVDFWTEDVDAAAQAASESGGKVIAPPFDIPDIGMRTAVLGDPQGATFSVTKVGATG